MADTQGRRHSIYPELYSLPEPEQRGRDLLAAGQNPASWQARKPGGILCGITEDDGVVYIPLSDQTLGDPCAGGGVFALDAGTGNFRWKAPASKTSCEAEDAVAHSPRGRRRTPFRTFFSHVTWTAQMRACEMKTGEIVCDFDAMRDFKIVNTITGKGGSFSASRPAIVDACLYTTCGYSGISGNVLLAFFPAL